MTPTLQNNPHAQKKRIRRIIITVILVSIGIHVAAGIIAGVVIVARYLAEPPAEFKATRDIRLPAKQREHKMNMAAFDGMTPKPSFNDRMQSIRPAAFALPELPKMPMDQMLPLDPSAIVSDQVSSLVGTAGTGGGGGDGSGGLGGTGTGFSFMGIQSSGKRILLMFDISGSVVNKAAGSGMPISRIKEEAMDLISKLPASSRFGIVIFTQNYKVFQDELVPATDPNRAAVKDWIETKWTEAGTLSGGVTNPKGFVGVAELAAKMQPDVAFLVSDASFQNRTSGNIANIPWDEIKEAVTGPLQTAGKCQLNFIGFQMKPTDKKEMQAIVRRTGGSSGKSSRRVRLQISVFRADWLRREFFLSFRASLKRNFRK
jgi:hypothetical protein